MKMKMKRSAPTFAYVAALGCTLVTALCADEHGGVHIRIPYCEGVLEEEQKSPEVCWEMKPWHSQQRFEEYQSIEEKADELQDDTTWPGQREDFSDLLMR